MILIDYTNGITFVIMLIFFIVMNAISIFKKEAGYTMVVVLISIAMFVLHVIIKDVFTLEIFKKNVMIDFASLVMSIPLLLVIDEIETRRSVIKSVFHKKYEKKK